MLHSHNAFGLVIVFVLLPTDHCYLCIRVYIYVMYVFMCGESKTVINIAEGSDSEKMGFHSF